MSVFRHGLFPFARSLSLCLLVFLLITRQADAQALIQNPNFANDFDTTPALVDWTDLSSTVGNASWNPAEAADLTSSIASGSGLLSQTGLTPLTAGHFYTVAFDILFLTGTGTRSLDVLYNNAVVLTLSTGLGNLTVGQHTATFFTDVSQTGPLAFEFRKSAGTAASATATIDTLILTDLGVPEIDPSSAAAPLALSVGGVFLALDRRRRKSTTV